MVDKELKPPTTYEEQLAILKEHGLIIQDEDKALTVLKNVNYYRLSAYFLTFKNENNKFVKSVTFEKIYDLYQFDKKLRNLLMEHLESIEISLRTGPPSNHLV